MTYPLNAILTVTVLALAVGALAALSRRRKDLAVVLATVAVGIVAMFGCAHRESAASRAYLNCVYHNQYELNMVRAQAEDACR